MTNTYIIDVTRMILHSDKLTCKKIINVNSNQ